MADHDDLEPFPLSPSDDAGRVPGAGEPASGTVVRDRFLVALAVVVGLAIVALGVQLRAIAADAEEEAVCTKALVAVVSSNFRGSASERDRVERQLQDCLGSDASLPGGEEG